MMKILDYIIFIYYFPLKAFKEKGLEGGVLLATLPLSFLLIALFFYLSQYFIPKQINFFNLITYGIIGGVVFISLNRFLKNRYLDKYRYVKDLEKKFTNIALKLLMIFFSVCIYIVSVLAVIYSLKFT